MDSACVFCDRKNLEERLIYENDDFYVVPTLGQITDGGYILLNTKRHVPCFGAIDKSCVDQFSFLVSQIRTAIKLEYRCDSLMIYEHGIVGQTIKHAHLHLAPKAAYLTGRILKDFPNSPFMIVQSWNMLGDYYADRKEPYLMWDDLNSGIKVCWNPNAPPQYMRLIYAEAVGRPERGNWRNMDPKLDKKLCDETVRRLKPYFPKYYL